MIISPSRLVVDATGLPFEGADVCDERHIGQHCAVCGDALVTGEPVDPLDLPASFTNHSALALPGGDWRCGACNVVMTRSVFQMAASTVLISREGIYPIVRKEHRAWAFLTPPAGPFAISIQNAKQQHVIWRAPVSLSSENIMIRVGEQVVRVRQRMLLAARDEAILLNGLNRSQGRPIKDGIENPFVNDWKMQSPQGGRFKLWLCKMIEAEEVKSDQIKTLLSLNGAEAWALTAALYGDPQKPESIASTI